MVAPRGVNSTVRTSFSPATHSFRIATRFVQFLRKELFQCWHMATGRARLLLHHLRLFEDKRQQVAASPHLRLHLPPTLRLRHLHPVEAYANRMIPTSIIRIIWAVLWSALPGLTLKIHGLWKIYPLSIPPSTRCTSTGRGLPNQGYLPSLFFKAHISCRRRRSCWCMTQEERIVFVILGNISRTLSFKPLLSLFTENHTNRRYFS